MRELRRIFTYNCDEDEDPGMREVRANFDNNSDEDEGPQDEGSDEDLYL
jgi:hypothetical protein